MQWHWNGFDGFERKICRKAGRSREDRTGMGCISESGDHVTADRKIAYGNLFRVIEAGCGKTISNPEKVRKNAGKKKIQ